MKSGGGKRKGSAYEREISKSLSLWLTDGKRVDCVWRTSGSGAMSTVNNSDTQCGDLHAVRPEAHKFFSIFSLELKNYKSLDIMSFQNKNFKLYEWWRQAENDANRANKIPLLIVRINRKGDWLIMKASANLISTIDFKIDTDKTSYINIFNKEIDLNLFMVPLDWNIFNREILI